MTTPLPGDFGLVSIPGTTGQFVRLGQWLNGGGYTTYEHAYIVTGIDELIEAEPGGARTNRMEYEPSGAIYSNWPLTPDQRTAIVAAARSLLGTPYSWLDYLSLAAHRLHIPAPHLRKYIADTGHMICSQLVDECYRRGGIHLFQDGRWPGDVTPADLAKVLTPPTKP